MNKYDPGTVQQWKSELEINRVKQARVKKVPMESLAGDVNKMKKSDLDAAVDRLENKIRKAEEE